MTQGKSSKVIPDNTMKKTKSRGNKERKGNYQKPRADRATTLRSTTVVKPQLLQISNRFEEKTPLQVEVYRRKNGGDTRKNQ